MYPLRITSMGRPKLYAYLIPYNPEIMNMSTQLALPPFFGLTHVIRGAEERSK